MKKIILSFIALIAFGDMLAQDLPTYNHYYIYPFLYNPSYMGAKERAEVNILNRQQWSGLEGAPVFSQFSILLPLSSSMATGLSAYTNKKGLITTTSMQAALSYTVTFARSKYLSFGLSAGAGRNSLDTRQVDLSDPAVANAASSSFFMEGQAGVNLTLSKLNIGFSLPMLFKRSITDPNSFQKIALSPFNTTITSISYKMDVGYSGFKLQPLVLYRTSVDYKGQWEGGATLFMKDAVWVGGMYRQTGSADVHLGFQISHQFNLGYSYEFATQHASAITYNTHEFRLAILFGKQKVNRDAPALQSKAAQRKKKSRTTPRYQRK